MSGRASAGARPLMVVDVGNTNSVFGAFRDDDLVMSLRLSTDADRTADEYGALLLPLLARAGIEPGDTRGVIISSVVPTLHPTFERLARRYFEHEPLFIEPGLETGMKVLYDPPTEVGADRIVNAVAARQIYGAPVVVVDFGTATTFDVINAAGEYVGGIIAPGLSISADALFSHASRLYRVDIRPPGEVVGRNTVGAIQSGLYYGYVGLVDGILARLEAEITGLKTVVATGGQAALIAEGSSYIREISPNLTLLGLKLIHDQNL